MNPLTQKPQLLPAFKGDVSLLIDLENQRGFQCKVCGYIYCMDCLFNYAPVHPNGGKACFKCDGSFTPLYTNTDNSDPCKVRVVYSGGDISIGFSPNVCHGHGGVLPALNLKSNIFISEGEGTEIKPYIVIS